MNCSFWIPQHNFILCHLYLYAQAGADLNSRNPQTPLVIATIKGLEECVEYLLGAGADANIPTNDVSFILDCIIVRIVIVLCCSLCRSMVLLDCIILMILNCTSLQAILLPFLCKNLNAKFISLA